MKRYYVKWSRALAAALISCSLAGCGAGQTSSGTAGGSAETQGTEAPTTAAQSTEAPSGGSLFTPSTYTGEGQGFGGAITV